MRRRVALLACLATSALACGPIDTFGDASDAAPADSSLDATSDGATYERTYLFTLDAQAFPESGHPGALVHLPPGFDRAQPFGVVVFVHGFENCIANCVETDATSCTPGAAPRSAFGLIDQFDRAHVPAVLVLPEVAYDEATGDPGQLGATNGLRAFLDELFSVQMAPIIGAHTVGDLGRVILLSHSGGYRVAAAAATIGGVPQLREVDLLDSLYGSIASYDAFVMEHVAPLQPSPDRYGRWRFGSVYTDTGGTDANNVSMAMRATAWVASPDAMLWDDTYATLAPADYGHPLIFKRSELGHDGVVRYYFEQFVRASEW